MRFFRHDVIEAMDHFSNREFAFLVAFSLLNRPSDMHEQQPPLIVLRKRNREWGSHCGSGAIVACEQNSPEPARRMSAGPNCGANRHDWAWRAPENLFGNGTKQ